MLGKFRVWDKENKNMRYPNDYPFFIAGCGTLCVIGEDGSIHDMSQEYLYQFFIGDQDVHNVDIYEGDFVCYDLYDDGKLILQDPNPTLIEYAKKSCGCCNIVYGYNYDPTLLQRYKECPEIYEGLLPRVIGNIHENPELLKHA